MPQGPTCSRGPAGTENNIPPEKINRFLQQNETIENNEYSLRKSRPKVLTPL